MTLQRILYSVPHLPHVRWEIAKAIQTLAATENWHLEQDDELAKVQSHRELMAEIVRDAWRILGKSGYDPHEPRVPAGNPDGGQWTNGGSNSFSNDRGIVSDRAPDRGTRSDYQYAANSPPGIGHNQGPPLEDPPEIPPRPPAKIGTFIKAAAYWIASAIAQADKRVALFLAAILAAGWIAGRYYKLHTRIHQRHWRSCSKTGARDTISITLLNSGQRRMVFPEAKLTLRRMSFLSRP